MTVKEVCNELDKIMQTLQSINAMQWNKREHTQASINEAYSIAEKLKKKLRGGTKDGQEEFKKL